MNELIDTLKLFLNMTPNDYSALEVNKIEFQSISLKNNGKSSIYKPITNELKSYKFGDYNLPLTTDISKWGTIIKHNSNVITLENSNYPGVIIVITVHSDKHCYEFLINGKIKFDFIDYLGSNPETFIRVIRKIQTLHVQDGEVVFKSLINKVKFINSEKQCNRIKTITFKHLEELLYSNSSQKLNQSKWFRNLGIGEINIKNQLYTVKATENKRHFFTPFLKLVLSLTF